MKPKQFFLTVMRMREAQRTFFRTRSQTALRESRMYEAMIDNEIERVRKSCPDDTEINPPPLIEPIQPTLNLD